LLEIKRRGDDYGRQSMAIFRRVMEGAAPRITSEEIILDKEEEVTLYQKIG